MDVECAKLLEDEGAEDKTTDKSEGWNTQDGMPFKARTLTREIKGSQKLQVSSFVDKKKTLGKDELLRKGSLLPYPEDSEYRLSRSKSGNKKLSQVHSIGDLKDSIVI